MAFDPTRIYRLRNRIQNYDWGSHTAMTRLLAIENPNGQPQAELWMGAHPLAPSHLVLAEDGEEASLEKIIEEQGDAVLGRGVSARLGRRLPFLFKVLAAEKALSIQAHPNLEQAREGFERESRAGVPLTAANRNYKDANHKPEILCALTDFVGMRGFRPAGEIAAEVRTLGIPELAAASARLERDAGPAGYSSFLERFLGLSRSERESLVSRVVERTRGRDEDRYRWIARLAEEFPGDIGVASPLFLNIVMLKPSEAMFLEAGILHAYLEGTGVELMANSDNVLRGGLTSKHIDVAELLHVLTFRGAPASILSPQPGEDGALVYPTPTNEFRLAAIDSRPGRGFDARGEHSAEILLCVRGGARVLWNNGAASLELSLGQSLFVPASAGAYRIEGEALIYRADLPLVGEPVSRAAGGNGRG